MLTGLHLWQLVISLLALLCLLVSGEEKMVADKDDENDVRSSKNIFNFASQAAGAVVLDKSPSTAKGYSHLLNDDMDKYGISACDEKKWVVIGLSEDILVTSIALANYEKYSSMLKEFQLLASTSYPTEKWINLGVYEAQPRLGMQTFNVSDSSVHTRYLKVKFNSHYGTEDLCTLSQIKVHGTTVIASFKQEVERSDQHMRDLISHLNGDGAIADSPSSDEVRANATEVAISATGEIKSGVGLGGEDGILVDQPEGNQELDELASAMSNDDGDEAKSNTLSDRGPADKNITDSKIDTRPATDDSNASTQNVTETSAAQDSTLSNASAKHVEVSQLPKNSLGVSNGMDISLGSKAEEAVSKENLSGDTPNVTLTVDVTAQLPASNDSAVSTLPPSPNSVAISTVVSSNVEKNGTEPLPGISAGSDAAGSSSGKTAEPNTIVSISEDPSDESSSVEVVKENTTTTNIKTEGTPQSDLPPVSPTATVDNFSAPTVSQKSPTNFTALAVTDGEAKADTVDSTKSAVIEATANGTVTATAAGESDKSNTAAALVNATAGRNEPDVSVSDDNVHNVLIGNMTVKSEIEVSSTAPVPDATINPPANMSTASAAAPSENGTTTCSNLTECSKESTLPLKRNIATNITGTSDLNSTVSTGEITAPAASALGTVVEADADADVRSLSDVAQKGSSHSDGASEGSNSADPLDGLPTATSSKYETILSSEDKEREWDKDDKISPLEAAALSGYGTLALGSVVSAAALSPLAAGPLSAALLDTPVLPLLAPHGQLRSINGPTVGFSPLCLETLRFTEFQAMMANKLKQRADSDKTQLPLHSQDNVFRQLMMKIKTLEMNYAIIEMYSAQVSECYRSALHEIYANMSQSQVHASKVSSDAVGQRKSSNGDTELTDIMLSDGQEEFLVPEGDGALKVLISGMGSTASLAAVEVDEDDSICPRVNTRNCTSVPLSQPSVAGCVGGKLNLLSAGILGVSLGASQGPAPLSVCSLKNGCASIEDLTALNPLLPLQLFLSEEDADKDKEQVQGTPASSPDSAVNSSEAGTSSDYEDTDVLAVTGDRTPNRVLRTLEGESGKDETVTDSSAHGDGDASRLHSLGLSEDEIMLVLGISLAVSSLSLILSVVLCVAFCCTSRSSNKTAR